MNKKDLKYNIKTAFDKATPDILESILSDASSGAQTVIVPEPVMTKRRSYAKRIAAAAAALLFISGAALGAYSYYRGNTAAAEVYLDVNPSVSISVNTDEEVISVTPNNSDGEKLLGTSDMIGDSLDTAINSIVDAMLAQGYLSEESNSILISVGGKDSNKAEDLRTRLTQSVSTHLSEDSFNGAVVGQTVDEDTALEKFAKKYGITESKAQFIRRILSENNSYSFEELAGLEITELTLITESEKNHVEGVEKIGSPSDKAYVGKENAVNAALDHVGIKKDDVDTVTADIGLKDGKVVYEIDLNYSGCDYGFMINAADGSILKFSQEIPYDTEADTSDKAE